MKRKAEAAESSVSLPWFHIMLALADDDRHGYGIMQEVERRTRGGVRLWPATLYGAVKRMLASGVIEESHRRPDPAVDDARRRYYRLTAQGRELLAVQASRLAELVEVAREKNVLHSPKGGVV
jgi:DNA-binding PadR family transcriptional regulator